MKTIKLLLLAFLISAFSCSPEEVDGCKCYKEIATLQQVQISKKITKSSNCKNLVNDEKSFYYVNEQTETIYRFHLICE